MRRILIIMILSLCWATSATAADGVIPLEGTVPDAAAMYLTQNGLDFIGDMASQILSNYDLTPVLMGLNPLFEVSSCSLIFMGSANITDFSVETFDVQLSTTPLLGLTPQANALYALISLYPAEGESLLTIGIDGYWGLGCTTQFNATASITADPVQLAASLTLDYNPTDGFVVTVLQTLINDDDLVISFTGLPDPSLESVLLALIDNMLPYLVETLGPELINEMLEEQLSGIVLEGTTTVGDYTMDYAFDPDFTRYTNGYGATTTGQLFLEGTTADPCIDPGDPIGSPYTDGPLPEFSTTTPNGDPYDAALLFSDDLLNQLVYSFLLKGQLCLMFPWELDQKLTLADFAGLFPDYELPKALEDAANLIDLYPVDLPQIVVGQGDADLSLVAQPYRLDWYIQKEGRYVKMLTAYIDLDLALTLSIDADNQLIVALDTEASHVTFDVTGNEYNILPPALIESLLNGFINNFLLPMLSAALPPIPLPAFSGYQLQINEIGAVGDDLDYFGLYCEFVEQSTQSGRPRAGFDLPGLGVVTDRVLTAAESARAGLSATAAPVLRLARMDGAAADSFRVRVDGGAWLEERDGRVELAGLLDGVHRVEAVAVDGLGMTTAKPARLTFVLDRVAPRLDGVRLARDGRGLAVRAHDYVAPAANLRMQWRVGAGSWSPWLKLDSFRLPAVTPNSAALQIRLKDPSGNTSRPQPVAPPRSAIR